MKILVTGGTSYIGSHTIVDLLEQGIEVVCCRQWHQFRPKCAQIHRRDYRQKVGFYPNDLCDNRATKHIFWNRKTRWGLSFCCPQISGDSADPPFGTFNNLLSLIHPPTRPQYRDQRPLYLAPVAQYMATLVTLGHGRHSQQPAASVYNRTKQMGEMSLKCPPKRWDEGKILLRDISILLALIPAKLKPAQLAQNLVPVIKTAIGQRLSQVLAPIAIPRWQLYQGFIHVCDLAWAHTPALRYLLSNANKSIETFNLGMGQGSYRFRSHQCLLKESMVLNSITPSQIAEGDVIAIYSDYSRGQRKAGLAANIPMKTSLKTAWQWELNKNNKA